MPAHYCPKCGRLLPDSQICTHCVGKRNSSWIRRIAVILAATTSAGIAGVIAAAIIVPLLDVLAVLLIFWLIGAK
jgi:RNA polymerase subunit RPABC4/transcription elongation factor Spt4